MPLLHPLYPKPAGTTADQRLTVDSTTEVHTFTAYSPADVMLVMLDVQTADVMCTVDGSDPTTTNGHRLFSGTCYTWSLAMFNAARFVAATATTASIHASPLSV